MCGVIERKEMRFLKIEKITYKHDIIIKNGQVHYRSLKIKICMIYF